jgi:hypothetical protein
VPTRVAAAARNIGIIGADVAVALALTATHNDLAFDRSMSAVGFDAPEVAGLPATGTRPVAEDRRDELWGTTF